MRRAGTGPTYPPPRVGTVGRMEFRRLGNSGLVVSVVGLGTNNLGMKLDMDGEPRGRPRRARRGHHALRHRRFLRRVRGPARRAAAGSARRRDLATKFGSDVRNRGGRQRRGLGRARLAALHAARRRIVAAQPAHRLDRPLPAAPPGPADADRRDAVCAGRSRARGQGALRRFVQLHRVAGRRCRVDRPHPRARSGSSARRTSTAGCAAASRPTSCRRSSSTGSACCPTSRWPAGCFRASTAAARRPPRAAA